MSQIRLTFQIQGERHPDQIFADFKEAFDRILDSEVILTRPRPQSSGSYREYRHSASGEEEFRKLGIHPSASYPGFNSLDQSSALPSLNGGKPFVIWICGDDKDPNGLFSSFMLIKANLSGGPGSQKSDRMDEIAILYPAWRVISISFLLWKYLEEEDAEMKRARELEQTRRRGSRTYDGDGGVHGGYFSQLLKKSDEHITANMVKNVMRRGEMVPQVSRISRIFADSIFPKFPNVSVFAICWRANY